MLSLPTRRLEGRGPGRDPRPHSEPSVRQWIRDGGSGEHGRASSTHPFLVRATEGGRRLFERNQRLTLSVGASGSLAFSVV